jgi:hypothetical protein
VSLFADALAAIADERAVNQEHALDEDTIQVMLDRHGVDYSDASPIVGRIIQHFCGEVGLSDDAAKALMTTFAYGIALGRHIERLERGTPDE